MISGSIDESLAECPVCLDLGLPRTLYCGEECQRADWKEHRGVHKRAQRERQEQRDAGAGDGGQ